jgi:hypothetical protein
MTEHTGPIENSLRNQPSDRDVTKRIVVYPIKYVAVLILSETLRSTMSICVRNASKMNELILSRSCKSTVTGQRCWSESGRTNSSRIFISTGAGYFVEEFSWISVGVAEGGRTVLNESTQTSGLRYESAEDDYRIGYIAPGYNRFPEENFQIFITAHGLALADGRFDAGNG